MSRSAILSSIALAAVATGVAVGTSASAQGPAGRTLELAELEQGSTFKHVRNTPGTPKQGMAIGDTITFTNPLTRDDKPAGRGDGRDRRLRGGRRDARLARGQGHHHARALRVASSPAPRAEG